MDITYQENRDFCEEIASPSALPDAIDWISTHLGPEDVFSEEALGLWAEETGWVKKK